MALTVEEKLEICQNTINDLQTENTNLKKENENLKKFFSQFGNNNEQIIIDYIEALDDTINTTNSEREKALKEIKNNNKEMKKSKREIDKLLAKASLKLLFMRRR